MQRLFILYLILTMTVGSNAMDFGLRFNSHSYPLEKRTSLSLGDNPIPFDKQYKVGFHFNFYTQPMFGTLVSVVTDDGSVVKVVASHQGDDKYMLGLVVNDRMKLMKGLITLDPDREDHVDISLDKLYDIAQLRYNNTEIEMPLDLKKTKSARATFGIDQEHGVTDAAPIEVRNIRLFIDSKNTNVWDLKYHDTPTSRIDELGGMSADAVNPHWLIDDHTDWHRIYSAIIRDNIQTAFNPDNECFYIVGDKTVKEWRPLTADSVEYGVNGGTRPMSYSNHLIYEPMSGRLLNYNLSRKTIGAFDFDNGVWLSPEQVIPGEEANYANHALAIDGDMAYSFGGYGFYKFHNDLFRLNLTNGTIEECKLNPEMMPATSAAAAVVNGKLYIFGGKGNSAGRQELPSSYHYAMYVYDTKTFKGELLWELDTVKHDFLPTQTMYYDALEDCFYAGSTSEGGEMIKISRTRPDLSVLSTPIQSKMEYHDMVFDLYRSKDGKRFYLLIDKRIDPSTHDYSIYTISAPFIDNPVILQNKSLTPAESSDAVWTKWWFVAVVVIVLVASVAALMWLIRRKRRKGVVIAPVAAETSPVTPEETPLPPSPSEGAEAIGTSLKDAHESETEPETESENEEDETITQDEENERLIEELLLFEKHDGETQLSRFDRSKSAISLLGAFNVRDKNGEDITTKFTDRLKSLLILLLLSNTKNANGIKYQTIDEAIWGDKDEKSAQNNRNVYMRKLRLLLEEVGDVPVTYEKGYFRINCEHVMYDYGEAVSRITSIQTNGNASSELVNETLDLLLMGPLLPMTTYEWLDQFKGDFSARAFEILNKLLKYEFNRNDELSYKIAQTISCHELLSEEAMKAKCILLSRKKMVGQAKKVYARFCKEYELSLGEKYPLTFPEVCKSQI